MKTRTIAATFAATAALALTATACSETKNPNAPKAVEEIKQEPAAQLDTGAIKVERLTDDEKRYSAALLASATRNGMGFAVRMLEDRSATEVQADMVSRRNKCGTPEETTSEEDIQKMTELMSNVPEASLRAYAADVDKATKQFICKK
ncbi:MULTISPECIES: hypothetical protein [unclassified Streptomyces]|uniref:hypothetical protein n=1 Tax=unclassified Streptomyces TaxID=2593676 RepID=UPI002030B389|nr:MULTISPECIES: hypothetical protein [unclassified Streptomyces]MCM1972084.1 hypothetical protein [Streptomyces sp. G1]MCX5125488.1 hypothetical protein [Streptomyces sp. NBC_00347]